MKRMLVGLAAMLLALAALPSQAAFHLFRIDQVYSNADGTIQYVVMHESTGSNGENFWAGLRLETTNTGGAKQQFTFPSGLPSSNTASRSVLIATAGFAALNLVTPDYTIPAGFIPVGGGKLDYASGVDEITFGVTRRRFIAVFKPWIVESNPDILSSLRQKTVRGNLA